MITNIKYVKTRNKLAHGDWFYQEIHLEKLLPSSKTERLHYGLTADYQLQGSQDLRALALVHLSKTLRFVKTFAEWRAHSNSNS